MKRLSVMELKEWLLGYESVLFVCRVKQGQRRV